MRDHTSKAFEPKAIDHHIVDFCGKNQVLVKDNYGNKKKVHVKDVKPIEMDIATAEFFRKEREQCTTRDAKHVMPIKLIPDLEWEFIENISVMESDKGVTIYCINETEDENEDTQVTKVSEPKTDDKTPENIEPVITEAVEAPRATQTTENSNITEIEKPRYEHRETSKDAVPRESPEIVAEDAVPRENSEISEDTLPRYEHRESPEIAADDAVPREIMEETGLTGNTGISQAILVDPTEDTETDVSEQTVAEQVEVTHTIDIAELVTGIPKPTLEAKENEESTTTPPGSPQRKNPEVQNKSRDNAEVNAEQAVKKTHKYPKTNNSIVNKIFSVFRQAKESLDTIPM